VLCELIHDVKSEISLNTGRLPLGLPDVFTANLAEASERPVFRKLVPETDILKIDNLP